MQESTGPPKKKRNTSKYAKKPSKDETNRVIHTVEMLTFNVTSLTIFFFRSITILIRFSYSLTMNYHLTLEQKLTVGTCLLGQIQQIDDIELTVSLPNQLIGYVSITQISSAISRAVETAANADSDDEMSDEDSPLLPDLKDLFAVGQWVRCAVLGKEGGDNDNEREKQKKRRIELSLNPEIVNRGIVVDDFVKGMVSLRFELGLKSDDLKLR